jgi:AraC-like DNA-binding protein
MTSAPKPGELKLVGSGRAMHNAIMAFEQRTLGRDAEPLLPAVHALHVAEIVERWNISPDQLLGELGLSREGLSEPTARLPIATLERLIQRACELTGEPGLGFHLGLKMRISAYGYVGFAAMTAENLRGALELACRFAPTHTSALDLRLERDEGLSSLVIDEVYRLGAAREALIIALVVGLWRIGCSITGRELDGRVDFAFPKPDYFERFANLAPGRVLFSMPEHRLVFDSHLLELSLVQSDPAALRLAREQCEHELDALRQRGGLIARVQSLLLRREGGHRSLEEIAEQSHTSVRTLERKLCQQGTSYSQLREQARRSAALELLGSESSIEDIAARLGYSDAANFTRAFRRWTGQTPRAYRVALRRQGANPRPPGAPGVK